MKTLNLQECKEFTNVILNKRVSMNLVIDGEDSNYYVYLYDRQLDLTWSLTRAIACVSYDHANIVFRHLLNTIY